MKGYKKLLVLFISMFVMCLIPTYKVHAYNRIVYSIYQEGESTFKIKLRWSDFENGNIQITTLAKKDDNNVYVYYKAYSTQNVREATIDTKVLDMKLSLVRPNVILRNESGLHNTLLDLPTNDEEMKQAIENLYQRGVINGYEDGTFKPNNTITKEEFSSMFYHYMEYELDTTQNSIFSDLQNDRWSKNLIMTLYKKGVINGQDDGAFGILKNVSLGEVSTMIARAKSLSVMSGTYDLVHQKTNHWANEYITKMVSNGLIKNGDKFYYSNSQNLNLTRGQVAIIMNRS